MKLVLDKPVTVAQGLTLEEADWGPWQFPQLLKREDGVLFASINLGPDNWESYGDTLWYKSSDNGRTWTDSNPSEAATAYPKAKNGDGFMAKDRGYIDIDPKLLEGIEPKHVLNFDDKPFFDYYLYSDLRPGTIDTSVMFMRLKKGETEQEGFCPKVTDNPGLCIVRPSGTDKLLPNKMFGRLRVAPDGSLCTTTEAFSTASSATRSSHTTTARTTTAKHGPSFPGSIPARIPARATTASRISHGSTTVMPLPLSVQTGCTRQCPTTADIHGQLRKRLRTSA